MVNITNITTKYHKYQHWLFKYHKYQHVKYHKYQHYHFLQWYLLIFGCTEKITSAPIILFKHESVSLLDVIIAAVSWFYIFYWLRNIWIYAIDICDIHVFAKTPKILSNRSSCAWPGQVTNCDKILMKVRYNLTWPVT